MPRVAIRAIPEASPSSPSMRLNAFTAPTIQNTVRMQSTGAGRAGHNVLKPSPPQHQVAKATASCPRSLSFGGSPHLSSAGPIRNMMPESADMRRGCTPTPDPTQRLPVARTYTTNEPKSPMKSATPPPRGIGTLLIRRGSGLSTMPSLRFSSRTTGVRTRVSARAAKKTIANGIRRISRFVILPLLRRRAVSATTSRPSPRRLRVKDARSP